MEILQNKKRDKETADQVAKAHGYDNYDSYRTDVLNDINSTDRMINKRGLDNVSSYAKDLVELILQQTIEDKRLNSYITNFANQFDDGWLTEGNSRQYINTIATGNTDFDSVRDHFVPQQKTHGMSEAVIIKMYNIDAQGNVVLTPEAKQYVKNYTIEAHMLVPYFKSGTLIEYINKIRNNMIKSWELFKYANVSEYIVKCAKTFKKQVAGTGKDMYDSMIEFLAHIESIQLLNQDYMLGDTDDIGSADVSNLIVIMHPDIKSRLQSGILTQLFNAQLLNNKGVLNSESITLLGKKLEIGDEQTPVKILADDYVDKNTIIVFDKRAFRFIYQLQQSGTQEYINNMTKQVTTHIWFTMGMLPWYQGFVYTNKNLSKLPAGPNN